MSPAAATERPRYASFTMLLPVYNEASRLLRVVAYYRRFAELVVVDNFSTDGTAELAKSLGVEVVQHRNPGTTQTPEWFRFATGLARTEYFAYLSCSELLPPALLALYDEVARARSADVVSCRRRIYTCGELHPGYWDDLPIERFFSREGLDVDAIAIHAAFRAKQPERLLRVSDDERFLVAHLRDADALTLTRKHIEYAYVEARDRLRAGAPAGPWWLLRISISELRRMFRVPFSRWDRVLLREAWSRIVMHSAISWMAWERRHQRGIDDSRARSAKVWEELATRHLAEAPSGAGASPAAPGAPAT